jgi:vacuolar-type H+-ATPase subunit E/Vma4
MESEQVIEKILADARAEADKIKKQADQKEADEHAKLSEQLNEYRNQTTILTQQAGEDEKSHILAAARMNIAKEYLAEKRKIMIL